MKERPILFSAPMVRALQDGSKTQARRVQGFDVINRNPGDYRFVGLNDFDISMHAVFHQISTGHQVLVKCPYGKPGDRLWVRETWQHSNFPNGPYDAGCDVFYRADYMDDPHGPDGERSPEGRYRFWKPSIHIPRSASRIQLEIVSVRVERLNAISEADAKAEGVEPATCVHEYYDGYAKLWGEINGAGSWEANPWVWAVEFKRVAA